MLEKIEAFLVCISKIKEANMQIREFMHQQINGMDIEQLLIAQEFLAALSAGKTKVMSVTLPQPYLDVRAALSALRGSLAEDIVRGRDDRV